MKTYGNVLTLYLTSLKNTKLESYSQRLVFQTVASCFASILPVCVILLPSWASSITFSPLLTKEHTAGPETPRKGSFFLSSSGICIIMVNKYFHKNIPSHTESSSFLDILSISWGGMGTGRGEVGDWNQTKTVCGYSWGVRDHCRVEMAKLKLQNQTAVCSF